MSFNPYANDELSRLENLIFLWTWILRWVPKSFATHPSLCNTLSSNTLCPKTVKMLALKGLMAMDEKSRPANFDIFMVLDPGVGTSMKSKNIENHGS